MGKLKKIQDAEDSNKEISAEDSNEEISESVRDANVEAEEEVQEETKLRKAKKLRKIEDENELVTEQTSAQVATEVTKKKRTRVPQKPLSPKQKWISAVLKAAEVEQIPPISELFRASGETIRICDIGIFASDEKHENDILAGLVAECPIHNEVNLEAPVNLRRVRAIGIEIMHVGWLTSGIEVAEIKENGSVQCISGRHRLAFLGLLYGVDAKVMVTRYHHTLSDARIACSYANQSRSVKTMEKAAFMVTQATDGQAVERDERYRRVATTKSNVANYCVYEILVSDNPVAILNFPVCKVGGRIKDGSLTTVTNLRGFWVTSLAWDATMTREDFEGQLIESVTFLNLLSSTMKKEPEFDPAQHLAAMPLRAVGRYYRAMCDAGLSPISMAEKVAQILVGLGAIGRDRSEETYNRLVKAMKSQNEA